MTRHYELGRLIGAGTFGTVHEAVQRTSGKKVAVKTMHKKFSGEFLEKHYVRRVRHEVDIYMHMGNSLNVAHLWDVYEDDTCVDLVIEQCTGGELWKRIRDGNYTEDGAPRRSRLLGGDVLHGARAHTFRGVTPVRLQAAWLAGAARQRCLRADACRIAREILRTVSQFHANGVVIRDVKPENFLFATPAADSHLKAIDFGIAQYCRADEVLKDRAGTPIYVAPGAAPPQRAPACSRHAPALTGGHRYVQRCSRWSIRKRQTCGRRASLHTSCSPAACPSWASPASS